MLRLSKYNLSLVLDERYSAFIHEMVKRYSKRCKKIEAGRNRLTFIFKNHVIKVPLNNSGISDNDWEGSISSSNDPDDIQFARTRLIYHKGIPIIFMERVRMIRNLQSFYEVLPYWVGFVDCGQVGFNKVGRLVAFDYGLN